MAQLAGMLTLCIFPLFNVISIDVLPRTSADYTDPLVRFSCCSWSSIDPWSIGYLSDHDHQQSQGFSKAGGENPFSASQDGQLISTANFKTILQHEGDFPLTANAQELPDNPAAAFQGVRSRNTSETFNQTSRSLHTRAGQETHVRAHPKSTSVPISSSYHITSDAQNGSALSAIKIRCCGLYDTSRIPLKSTALDRTTAKAILRTDTCLPQSTQLCSNSARFRASNLRPPACTPPPFQVSAGGIRARDI